ncbi:hypothetical protein PLUA15_130009 [Pseudomonas lundensis]|uniref:Transposase n=1 Tax=Pseudomonas lundensis TaxID=86185 RepID=A0AAX2H3K5_9PSED|nr:hypothetical protein PLUA15_130009 [Pseudomonas lundensis]
MHALDGLGQLRAAITALGTEDISGQAFRVQTHQRTIDRRRTQFDNDMFLVGFQPRKAVKRTGDTRFIQVDINLVSNAQRVHRIPFLLTDFY